MRPLAVDIPRFFLEFLFSSCWDVHAFFDEPNNKALQFLEGYFPFRVSPSGLFMEGLPHGSPPSHGHFDRFSTGKIYPPKSIGGFRGKLEDKSWEYTRSSQGLGLGHPSPLHEGSEV